MSSRANLLGGIGASVWIAALNFLATPFYLHYLGVEAYGLIGFYIAAQALLTVLDMGLGPTVSREIARDPDKGKSLASRVLLLSLGRVYWAVALLFLLLGANAAVHLSDGWFVTRTLSNSAISDSLLIMVFVLALRWPIVLYQSTLVGADRLAWVGLINAVVATASVISTLLVLALASATLQAFFLTQVIFAAIHLLAMRAAAWQVLGGSQAARFDTQRLRQIWRFASGTGAIALTSVAFTQLDKIIISKLAGLESFGYYALAVAVTSALYLVVSPVFNVIYPRMSAQVAEGRLDDMERYYMLGSKLLSFVVLPIGITLAYYAQDLVLVWTGDPVIAEQTAPLLSLLAVGSSLHAMMFFPYGVQLSLGNTRLPLLTNLCLMLISIPALVLAVVNLGALGGAMAWLGLQASYLLLGSWLTHHYLLAGPHWRWLFPNVIMPLLGVVVFVHFSEQLILGITDNAVLRLVLAAAVGAAIVAALISSSKDTREGARLLLLGTGAPNSSSSK